MIRIIYVFSFLLINKLIFAQNLVYNGGMEGMEKQQPCHWKSLAMQEQSATYQWFAPTEQLGKYVSKPYTPTYKQGNVQAMLMFRAENSAYMIVELKRPLLKGEEVSVELEAVASYMQNGEALDEIGALLLPFSPSKASELDIYKTNDILHLTSKTFPKLDSRDRWMPVEAIFTAKGGEQFLVIGNFKGNNFSVISRNQTVGNWYQSSAATGNAKGWFGFIFDNVSVTSLKNQEADGAYNNISDCGYNSLPSKTAVSPTKEVANLSKNIPTQVQMQAKSVTQNPPSSYVNKNNLALVTPKNPPATTPKNTERGLSNPYQNNPNMALVSPKTAEKTLSTPSNAPILPKTESKPSNSYYVPSKVIPKVNMQAEIIFFDTKKANLSDKAFILLDNMAKKLAQNPKLSLQINGYANETNENSYATIRANAAQAYLRSKGIDPKRLPIKVIVNSNISNYISQSGKVDFIWIEK